MNKKTTAKSLRVTCDTKLRIPLDELNEIQGDLKEMTADRYKKFRKLVLKKGIWFTLHVWKERGRTLATSEGDRKGKLIKASASKPVVKWWIIDGHGRKKMFHALRDEGYKIPDLPCVEIEAANIKEAKEAVLAASSQFQRTTGQGLYEFVEEAGFKPEVIDDFDLAEINASKWKEEFYGDPDTEGSEDEADNLPELVPVVAVQGDVWTLGKHRLVCGDSTSHRTIGLLMQKGEKADLVVTDPPYNLVEKRDMQLVTAIKSQAAYKKMADDGWDEGFEIKKIFEVIEENVSLNVSVYIFTSQFIAGEIWEWFQQWNQFADFCVWTKSNPMPSLAKRGWTSACELICYTRRGKHVFNFPDEGHCPNWFRFSKPMQNRVHPTQKPVKLIEYLIEKSSMPGQIVLDLFAGSGTTLMACQSTGRVARCVERELKYCDVILERYFLETKKDPIRQDGVPWSKLRKVFPQVDASLR